MMATSCSAVRPSRRLLWARSDSVSTKKMGQMLDVKKWSNHTASSTVRDCKNDLSKRVMGARGARPQQKATVKEYTPCRV